MDTLRFARFEQACNNGRAKVISFLKSGLIQIKFLKWNIFEEQPSEKDVLDSLEKKFIKRLSTYEDSDFPDNWSKMIYFTHLCVQPTPNDGKTRVVSPFPPGNYDKMQRFGQLYNLLHTVHYDKTKQGGREFDEHLTIEKIPIKSGRPLQEKTADDVAEPTHRLDPLDAADRVLENMVRRGGRGVKTRRALMAVKARSKELRDTVQFTEG